MPAHTTKKMVGKATKSNGEKITRTDHRANWLVDLLAKHAAFKDRVPVYVRKLFDGAGEAVEHAAALVGAQCKASNTLEHTRTDEEGKEVKTILRDSVPLGMASRRALTVKAKEAKAEATRAAGREKERKEKEKEGESRESRAMRKMDDEGRRVGSWCKAQQLLQTISDNCNDRPATSNGATDDDNEGGDGANGFWHCTDDTSGLPNAAAQAKTQRLAGRRPTRDSNSNHEPMLKKQRETEGADTDMQAQSGAANDAGRSCNAESCGESRPDTTPADMPSEARSSSAATSSLEHDSTRHDARRRPDHRIEQPIKVRKLVAIGCHDDIDEAERECDERMELRGGTSDQQPIGKRKEEGDGRKKEKEKQARNEPSVAKDGDEGSGNKFVFYGSSARDEMVTDKEAFDAEVCSHKKALQTEREVEASRGSEPKPPAGPPSGHSPTAAEEKGRLDKNDVELWGYAIANAPKAHELDGRFSKRRSKGKARARLDIEAQRLNSKKQNARRSLMKKDAKARKTATAMQRSSPPICAAPKKGKEVAGRATPTVCTAVQEWWRTKRKGREKFKHEESAKKFRLVGKTTREDAAELGVT